jgi:hypothetical protein
MAPVARKVELPADGAAYVPPTDATADDLAAMIDEARATATALLKDDSASADDVAKANQYIEAISAITVRQQEIQAAADEHAQAIAEARARLTPAENTEADDDTPAVEAEKQTDPVVVTDSTVDPDVGVTAGEPVLVASADGNGRTVLRPTKDAAITAPARRSAVAAAAGVGPGPQMPVQRDRGESAYLTAAAEVRGVSAGSKIDWSQFGVAAEGRFNSLPHPRPGTSRPNAGRTQLAIGSVHMQTHDEGLVADGKPNSDFAEADSAIDWAISQDRLAKAAGGVIPQGESSLTAAGGWCAPSETLYDLLDITTDDGLLDVPGITVTRGGVRYSLGPDFTQVYVTGNANFTRTEAQAIAGSPTKPMVNIPCPTFTDNRMVVDGLYLTGDILSSKGYPEAYADYTQKALKAFAHFVNAASIVDQVSLSTTVDLSVVTGANPPTNRTNSAATELLGAVELQVTDMRYKNRLSMTQAVEVVMPFWLRGNIRTDIAKRQGWSNPFSVGDDEIRSWFAERGASIQFVYDWQDAFTGVAAGFGAATAIAGWPATANILVYPQGTFVRALDPVIELNAVYDSTLLQTNQYVALFMEQGRLTLKRHWDSRNLKVAVNPLGATTAGVAPLTTLTGSVL